MHVHVRYRGAPLRMQVCPVVQMYRMPVEGLGRLNRVHGQALPRPLLPFVTAVHGVPGDWTWSLCAHAAWEARPCNCQQIVNCTLDSILGSVSMKQ